MGGYAPTLGGLLLGSLLNTYFYGIVFMQVVAYFGMKFDDPFWVKVFVASLFCLDSVNAASLVYGVWWFAVENHNNPQALRILLWPLPFTIMVITLVAFMVQTFLAYRLLRLTQSKLRYVIVMLLSLLAFMAGLVVSVTTLQVRSQGRNESVRAETGITVWLASEVGVDISLTAMLVAVLLPRSGGTFHKSNTLVNRLIRGAVQTGRSHYQHLRPALYGPLHPVSNGALLRNRLFIHRAPVYHHDNGYSSCATPIERARKWKHGQQQ
ncbi:hypothetical protein LshimejAT787_1005580 [Lyophyllum shimeji]|uniref:Uncharacterized protein n=1 Tax=Lyophyllum shimeji TaxID=47721 RepID=A0A9P3PUS8_LYOSH|nr:hypothetical protein LshimejAT787_1005580 [Lyophyllum shimeji]